MLVIQRLTNSDLVNIARANLPDDASVIAFIESIEMEYAPLNAADEDNIERLDNLFDKFDA